MGGTHIRVMWLVGTILIGAACASAQSPRATTVSGGGADVPDQDVAEVRSASDEKAAARDLEEAGENSDEADASSERRSRRRTKMVSYEEAMARPVEIGDAAVEGGEAQLSGDRVARLMDDHLDEMYDECIEQELRRGNELGTVTIDLAIRGKDGMILGATIDPGRRRFKKCLENYLEDVRFPEFASPRMGARYRFHAG